MATKTITTRVDDIDGSDASASFTFTWNGYKYHIDLSDAHAAEMRADFDKWVSVARRDRGGLRVPRARVDVKPAAVVETVAQPVRRGPGRPAGVGAAYRGRSAKQAGPAAADVRIWAAAKGIPVASRGRLAPGIIARYLEDQS